MTGEPIPVHVCEGCGMLNERAMQAIADLEKEADVLREAHLAASVALGKEQSKVGRLRTEQVERLRQSKHMEGAQEVFEFWRRELHPKAKEFSGKRLENVIARLAAGKTVEELKEAILGCKARPFVRDGKAYTDLELICRSEKHVDDFRDWYRIDLQRRAEEAVLSAEDVAREARMRGYAQALTGRVALRLQELRGWHPVSIENLGLGLDRDRVVFPVRDAENRLVGFARYAPDPGHRKLKMVAEGPRELFPPPESYAKGGTAWLMEGEGDAVSGRTLGLVSVGLPGVQTWKPDWPERFARFEEVAVCLDCDEPGREAAHARAGSLASVVRVRVVDLDPARDDGWDVTDALRDLGRDGARRLLLGRLGESEHQAAPIRPPGGIRVNPRAREGGGIRAFVDRLEEMGCRPRPSGGGQWTARCPGHDDRHASLRATERDGKVLLVCYANCSAQRVIEAMGLEWGDLFESQAARL